MGRRVSKVKGFDICLPPGYEVGQKDDYYFIKYVAESVDNSGYDIPIYYSFTIAATNETEVAERVYEACLGAMEHELQEWFTIDGVRLYEPH